MLLLSALLVLLPGCGERRQHAAAQHQDPAVDWSRVSSRDLDLASVFLVARERGVRPALDSLAALVRADPELEPQGHAIAHGLGRFAVAARGYDLAVFAECRPIFLSGCYHGVLEGYLGAHPHAGAAQLAAVCVSPAVAALPPWGYRECAHGMGHGLSGMHGHRLAEAVADCAAALPDGVGRRECWDGAYMENVVHAFAAAREVNVGDAMAHRHQQGDQPASVRGDDPYFPCDSVGGPAAASCWAYQPVVWMNTFGSDLARVRAGCTHAPAAAAAACWSGLGKQTLGRTPGDSGELLRTCVAAGRYRDDCIAGAVAFLTDQAWEAAPGFAFCASVPAEFAPGCYRAVGSAVGWIDPAPAAIERACAVAGRYTTDCATAAKAEHAAETVRRETRHP